MKNEDHFKVELARIYIIIVSIDWVDTKASISVFFVCGATTENCNGLMIASLTTLHEFQISICLSFLHEKFPPIIIIISSRRRAAVRSDEKSIEFGVIWFKLQITFSASSSSPSAMKKNFRARWGTREKASILCKHSLEWIIRNFHWRQDLKTSCFPSIASDIRLKFIIEFSSKNLNINNTAGRWSEKKQEKRQKEKKKIVWDVVDAYYEWYLWLFCCRLHLFRHDFVRRRNKIKYFALEFGASYNPQSGWILANCSIAYVSELANINIYNFNFNFPPSHSLLFFQTNSKFAIRHLRWWWNSDQRRSERWEWRGKKTDDDERQEKNSIHFTFIPIEEQTVLHLRCRMMLLTEKKKMIEKTLNLRQFFRVCYFSEAFFSSLFSFLHQRPHARGSLFSHEKSLRSEKRRNLTFSEETLNIQTKHLLFYTSPDAILPEYVLRKGRSLRLFFGEVCDAVTPIQWNPAI